MASLERQHFWGCTLTKDKPEIEWLASDDHNELNNEVDILNQLALSQACLGPKAKESASHVVQVTTIGVNSNKVTQPIIILGAGVKQAQCRLEFSSSATFKLIEGHGPVHLAGSHIQVVSGDFPSDEESDDEGIDSAKQSPRVAKNPLIKSTSKHQPPAKRAKMDSINVEDDEPDILIPIKDIKTKKTAAAVVEKKAAKKEKPEAKKGPLNLFDIEAEEDSESEESDVEGDEEEDDEDDDDFEGGDSDDDMEEGDVSDDNSDDDSDEELDEDDVTEAIVAKKKKAVQQNGTPKVTRSSSSPVKKDSDSSGKKTPVKASLNASITLQKTPPGPPDMDEIKQKLLKSPNLPKKIEKFRNFAKTNLRVTGEKDVKELWTWIQKHKK